MNNVIPLAPIRRERAKSAPGRIVHAGMWQARPVRHKASLWWGIVIHALERGDRTDLVVNVNGQNRVVAVEDVEEMLDRGTAS